MRRQVNPLVSPGPDEWAVFVVLTDGALVYGGNVDPLRSAVYDSCWRLNTFPAASGRRLVDAAPPAAHALDDRATLLAGGTGPVRPVISSPDEALRDGAGRAGAVCMVARFEAGLRRVRTNDRIARGSRNSGIRRLARSGALPPVAKPVTVAPETPGLTDGCLREPARLFVFPDQDCSPGEPPTSPRRARSWSEPHCKTARTRFPVELQQATTQPCRVKASATPRGAEDGHAVAAPRSGWHLNRGLVDLVIAPPAGCFT